MSQDFKECSFSKYGDSHTVSFLKVYHPCYMWKYKLSALTFWISKTNVILPPDARVLLNLPDQKIQSFISKSWKSGGVKKKKKKNRSSHRRCSARKGVLRNFAKFKGKHLCQSLYFNKVANLRPATLLKQRLWHRCFPVNSAKFLRTPFLQNTSGRQLLKKKPGMAKHTNFNQMQ